MQELLSSLLRNNPEIDEAVARYCRQLPGYAAAKRQYDQAAGRLADAVDFSLYDEFQTCLLRYTDFEVQAYFRFGLELRENLIRELNLSDRVQRS